MTRSLLACVLLFTAGLSAQQTLPTPEESYEWQKEKITPQKPRNPNPADGALNVPTTLTPTFRATGSDTCNYYYSVHPQTIPSTTPVVSNVTCGGYTFSGLSASTKIYWRVQGNNTAGSTLGDIWNFTTAAPACTPQDCVLSAWSAWVPTGDGSWSSCVSGTQTRPEQRTRTVVTPANACGAACGPLTETRTATQNCTPPPPPPASEVTFAGQTRDVVRQSETVLTPDGNLDGSFTVVLDRPRQVIGLRLTTTGGTWDTVAGNTNWALGAALTPTGALVNAADSTVYFNATSFTIFAADFTSPSPSFFTTGKTFTLIVTFWDTTTYNLTVTIGGGTAAVNCQGTWSAWAPVGSCVNNQQTEQQTFTVTTPASGGGTACPSSPATRTVACGTQPPSGDVITLAPATLHQTMRGWEVVAQAEQDFQPTRFPIYAPAVLDQAAALGIDRIQMQVRAGMENPTDYYAAAVAAGMTVKTPSLEIVTVMLAPAAIV